MKCNLNLTRYTYEGCTIYSTFTQKHLLIFVQEICSHLTRICQETHQFLANKQQKLNRNVIDTVFLALRQLTCCINNLEKIAIAERQQSMNLKVWFGTIGRLLKHKMLLGPRN